MIERGLLKLRDQDGPPRLYFTPAGLAALRDLFTEQPADFVLPYPRLHDKLGLKRLLPGKRQQP